MLRLVASAVAESERLNIGVFSLVLVDDEAMADLNRDLRSTKGTTDVIAFEAEAGPDGQTEAEAYISVPRAAAQAAEHRHSTEWELAFLVAHALLHAAGCTDQDPQTRKAMMARQNTILTKIERRIGIARH